MDKDVALKATSLFFGKNKNNNLSIKFFGGEPLLEFDLVKKVARSVKKEWPGKNIRFNLTTNGILLNNRVLNFIKENPNLELMLSLDANRPIGAVSRGLPQLLKSPDIGVNITITPNNVERFSNDFIRLTNLGFKKFNFLPAYFLKWDRVKAEILKFEFRIISELIRNLARGCGKIEVKNIKTHSRTPLFNNGVVVDCNGDIFLNNLVLSKHFIHLRNELMIGNVNDAKRVNWNKRTDFNKIIKDTLDSEAYGSTLEVDAILTEFVSYIK